MPSPINAGPWQRFGTTYECTCFVEVRQQPPCFDEAPWMWVAICKFSASWSAQPQHRLPCRRATIREVTRLRRWHAMPPRQAAEMESGWRPVRTGQPVAISRGCVPRVFKLAANDPHARSVPLCQMECSLGAGMWPAASAPTVCCIMGLDCDAWPRQNASGAVLGRHGRAHAAVCSSASERLDSMGCCG